MVSQPPTPDLADVSAEGRVPRRGILRVFFGYAAGVGKTYGMLEAAQAARGRGVDVVVGYLEPHTRADTMALATGLETVPTKKVRHRSLMLQELDVDAILARRPQVVLVDELAHTNAPGSRHKKRYQDVEELLRAGINVYTTVNVQHLESLNDKVAAITRVRVHERIPDFVFDQADEVELVDIEPDDLIERLRAGKIYTPERADTALDHFFTKPNLSALREIAVRRMADRMAHRKQDDSLAPTAAAGECVLVYVTADEGSVKVVRAAANLAQALFATFIAVAFEYADDEDEPDVKERKRLSEHLNVAEELGAQVVMLQGDDIAQQLVQYAQTCGATQLVVGGAVGLRRLPGAFLQRVVGDAGNLAERLISSVTNAVVTVVPMRDFPAQLGARLSSSLFKPTFADFGRALAAVALSTLAGLFMYEVGVSGYIMPMLYTLVALLFATRAQGIFYTILVSVGSLLAYNFFFIQPRLSLASYGLSNSFIFAMMFASILVASLLTLRMKRQNAQIARRVYRTEVLLGSNRELTSAADAQDCFRVMASQIIKLTNRPVVVYATDEAGRVLDPQVFDVAGTEGDVGSAALISADERAVALWVATNDEPAGVGTDTLPNARCLYLPVRGKEYFGGVVGIAMDVHDEIGAFERNLLIALAGECGQALERLHFARERRDMAVQVEKESLRSNLLRTISHDLRTPLTSISGDTDVLLHDKGALSVEQKRQLLNDMYEDATWLVTMVENLLSVTRIDEGSVRIEQQPELASEVIGEALAHVSRHAAKHTVRVEVADDLLMASMDARLIVQVLINLVNNAVTYTPEGSMIVVSAKLVDDPTRAPRVRFAVTDDGPGLTGATAPTPPASSSETIPTGDIKRGMGLGLPLCQSIVAAHGSKLVSQDVHPHGCAFWFDLPAVVIDASGMLDAADDEVVEGGAYASE